MAATAQRPRQPMDESHHRGEPRGLRGPRRAAAIAGGLLVTALVASACSTASGKSSLTMVTYGGDAVEPMKAAYADPVAKDRGISIVQDSPTDYGKLEAMQKADNVTWNVINAEPFMTSARCGEMFEKRSDVDLSAIDQRFVTDDCSVPADAYSIVLVYDKTKFVDHPPTTWSDFLDTQTYPGKRAVWNYVGGNALEIGLLGDGVAPDQLYPLDTDRAYAALGRIKDELTFYSSLAQSTEMLLNGQVSMVATLNTRAYVAAQDNPDQVGVSWDQSIVSWEAWAVPKGAPEQSDSMAVLNEVASPDAQADLAASYPVGPTATDADLSEVPESLRAWLPTTPEHLADSVLVDMGYYADSFDELNAGFTDFQSD